MAGVHAMRRFRHATGLLGVLAVAALPFAAAAQQQPTELKDVVRAFIAAVAADESATVATLACVDALGAEVLHQAERSGVIADAADPALVAAYESAYVAAVKGAIGPLLDGGAFVRRIDDGDVALDEAVPPEERGLAALPGTTVTGVGIVHAKLGPSATATDFPVIRLDATWCVNPVTVQAQALLAD